MSTDDIQAVAELSSKELSDGEHTIGVTVSQSGRHDGQRKLQRKDYDFTRQCITQIAAIDHSVAAIAILQRNDTCQF